MEFWLSGSLSQEPFLFFHDGILAIRKPFTLTFLFFTMELWLPGSLSHEIFFSQWNSGYQEAFSQIFISHDVISATTEPFHEFSFT
jgi:hypothetical protein